MFSWLRQRCLDQKLTGSNCSKGSTVIKHSPPQTCFGSHYLMDETSHLPNNTSGTRTTSWTEWIRLNWNSTGLTGFVLSWNMLKQHSIQSTCRWHLLSTATVEIKFLQRAAVVTQSHSQIFDKRFRRNAKFTGICIRSEACCVQGEHYSIIKCAFWQVRAHSGNMEHILRANMKLSKLSSPWT